MLTPARRAAALAALVVVVVAVGLAACGTPAARTPRDAGPDALGADGGGAGNDAARSDAASDPCAGYSLSSQKGDDGPRVFALQPRIDMAHLASQASFRAYLTGLVERRVRPCLAKDRPNLIVFPESVGLPAALIGERAEAARRKRAALVASLVLMDVYKKAAAYYDKRWPGLALGQKLALMTTDTVWRAVFETTRDIARSTGAWVITSADVAGKIERSSDPADIAALGDPAQPSQRYVYVARQPQVYNTAFVFDPQGTIVARRDKPYLVLDEEGTLSLTWGAIDAARPVDLGFARLGIVTSKDAWMPDMMDRLAILGADVYVQPEAFAGWGDDACAAPPCKNGAHVDPPDVWLPNIVKQSGWQAVQKHGGLRYGVIPILTGNFFDLVFDGQATIIGEAKPQATRWAYIGQPREGGFVSLAPWVVPDPVVANPGLDLAARRAELRRVAKSLLPGGSRAGRYVESAAAADLDLRRPRQATKAGAPGALGASRAVDASSGASGAQLYPAVASDGKGLVVVAWQDQRAKRPQIYVARSSDGGKTFGAAAPLAPVSDVAQRTPALVIAAGSVYAAWQQGAADGALRVRVARSSDGGKTFGAAVELGSAPTVARADEWLPALAAGDTHAYVTYVATIDGNERVQLARAPLAKSLAFTVSAADVTPPTSAGKNPRNNQWSPSIAARGAEVAVSWVDFRDYNWDVYLARSSDRGASFSSAKRIDDGSDHFERLHDDVALAFAADGALLAGWSDLRRRRPAAQAHIARAAAGASFGASTRLASQPSSWASSWRPRLALPNGKGHVVAVWQDHRSGSNDVYLASSSDNGASFGKARRLDDGGDGASAQLRPDIAAVGNGQVIVVWVDTLSGRRRLRYVVGAP